LLPVHLAIVERYKNHPQCVNWDRVVPVRSNQKLNEYLKEIADLCGIPKRLTYHMARHTFATTVTLNNGVPIDTVSKMLGHKKLQTTQIYAKVLDNKISADMGSLRTKLSEKSNVSSQPTTQLKQT
jgi:integrase